MGKDIDPADIGKHPDVIRKAQAEFAQTDVLVCGRCHSVFHFVDPFREHKELDCKKDSTLKDCTEAKGKVWAFLLWKSAQLSAEGDGGTVNSWKLYQTWVKLEEAVRETWIVAGRTIQSFAKTGQGTLQEMPVKITKTVVETGDSTDKKPTIGGGSPQTAANRFPVARKPDPKLASAGGDLKKPGAPTTPVKKPEQGMKNVKRSFAKRTTPLSADIREEEVEKILAKRFNPRRKEHEYLVKWTKLAHDQNTWEPLMHLQTCQSVLEYFEVQLAKQKEQRAAAAARTLQQQQEKNKMALSATANNVSTPVAAAGGNLSNNNIRPVRNSKTNATDRVKQWCSSTSPQADDSPTGKRKAGESDPESPEQDESSKRIRTDSGSINQAITRVAQSGNVKIVPVGSNSSTAINGGISNAVRKDETNMAEVVIKSSRDNTPSGVVKKPGAPAKKPDSGEATVKIINRGEVGLPGIFKVKSDTVSPQTSPVAAGSPTTTTTTRFIRRTVNGTSQFTKQTVRQTIPVSKSSPVIQHRTPMPKQGTSNVPLTKVSTTTLQRSPLSPKVQATSAPVASKTLITRTLGKPVAKITPSEQKINALRKQGLNVVKRLVSSSTNNEARNEEEEDDGLVDPFPSNLPPPTPPSPPRALTLCPVTGKVLGQAEGEPTPVPSPEVEEEKKDLKGKKDDELADQQNVQDQDTQVQQFLTNEDGSPIIVAGEDGTLYQVAGKNAEGQTILIAQGADGEQSCVLVASTDEDGGAGGVLTLDAAVSEAVAQISVPQEAQQLTDEQAAQFQAVDQSQQLTIQTEDSQDGQITAEVVQADQPSPGGTRRVVLLLPDGSFMMTEVNEEQYQSLNLVT